MKFVTRGRGPVIDITGCRIVLDPSEQIGIIAALAARSIEEALAGGREVVELVCTSNRLSYMCDLAMP
jgi:acyl-CoA reductase-like NAD-dependent aldehyde dehydrogenase